MPDILYQEKKDEITAGFFNKNAFTEKKRLLLVLKTGIAGMNHHVDVSTEEGKKILSKLTPGTKLSLYRDPDNEHDEWAVCVCTEENEEIGYITRFKNETIARLMDYGKKFVAVIDEPENREGAKQHTFTENLNVPFSVYLEE